MKPTVYIETTIISYLTARPSRDVVQWGHQLVTREWWDGPRDLFELYSSDVVVAEASAGDPAAAAVRLKTLSSIPRLAATSEALELAEKLAAALSLPLRARLDAAHAAIAAVHGIDFLMTWNCRHLANGALAHIIEQTCSDAGYVPPRVLTPEQLMVLP